MVDVIETIRKILKQYLENEQFITAITTELLEAVKELCDNEHQTGYDKGYSRGQADGHCDGYSIGRAEGYDEGLRRGRENGIVEALRDVTQNYSLPFEIRSRIKIKYGV